MKGFFQVFLRILLPVSLVVALGLISYFWGAMSHGTPKNMNELGDLMNVPNTLFSGLALIGIVYTAYIQSEELRKSSISNRESNEALKLQMELQQKMIRLQILTTLLKNESDKVDRADRWNDRLGKVQYSNERYRENCKDYEEQIQELENEIFEQENQV